MLKWLESAVFYQIYPISFFDSNGDGLGDLKGIEQKVDYIKSLGVDAVWLNPFFKSPFKDAGYDISDYYQVDKKFGCNDDLVSLISAFKSRGIKVVLDIVIGHTSDKHRWFKKSANAKRNSYSDYFVWTDSVFTEYNGVIRGLYKRDGGYLPNFYACQPALNFGFENADEANAWKIHYKDERLAPVRREFINIMRYYLDLGVDGFRIDLAASIVKEGATFSHDALYDDSEDDLQGVKWVWEQILGELRRDYKDKVFIAEWVLPQRSIKTCGFDVDFLTHDTPPFNSLYRNEKGTNLVDNDYFVRGFNYFSPDGEGSLKDFTKYIEYLYSTLGNKGLFTSPSGTHDEIRMATGKSPDMVKTIFAFLLTYKQIPFIYYGDEIGLEHDFSLSKDGGGSRTGARTPMQWTEEKGRGFSIRKWTYLPTSYKKGQSVESQNGDENSILNAVRRLVKIRKEHPALHASANQTFIETGYPAVFKRVGGGESITVFINPSNQSVKRQVSYSKVIMSQNADICGDTLTLNAQSFAILLD